MRYVDFSVEMGGVDSGHVVGPHLSSLARLLNKYIIHEYVFELDELHPIFRVDGEVHRWDKEGLERLRLARKQRYITVDIMMPRSRWEEVTPTEIRRFINDNFKEALHRMVDRLKKEHMEVNEERLFKDYAKVEKEFLSLSEN
jgi:hypothetical protein